MSPDLAKRLLVAAVGVPVCIAVVYAGGVVFTAGMALLALVSYGELRSIHRSRPAAPFLAGALGAAGFPFAMYLWGLPGIAALAALAVALVATGAMLSLDPSEGPVVRSALSVFGMIYIGGLLAFGLPLRLDFAQGRAAGTALFFLPVGVTWLADTAAYFGGKALGRRKLAPRISPNKTVAGAVAALLAGPIGGWIYGWLLLPLFGGPRLEGWLAAVFGLLIAGTAIFGDLVESSLKRECRVKDASQLLPGHGGLLDRLDSLLFAFPMTYLLFRILRS